MTFQFLPSFCHPISSTACSAHPFSTPGLSWAQLHGLGTFYPADVIWPQLNKLRLTKGADHGTYKHKSKGFWVWLPIEKDRNKTGVISHSPGSQFIFHLRAQLLYSYPYMSKSLVPGETWSDRLTAFRIQREPFPEGKPPSEEHAPEEAQGIGHTRQFLDKWHLTGKTQCQQVYQIPNPD